MTKKKAKQNEPIVKRRETFTLNLTKFELVHLRDLFSIMLPPDMKTSVSQSLAVSQERTLIETKLWQKISSACFSAKLPVNDSAPDFIISPTGPPPMGVFELAQEPNQQKSSDNVEEEVGTVYDGEEE